MAALLALVSSLLWGTGDFLGGRASRQHATIRVLAWSQLAAAATVWSCVAIGAATGALEVTARALLLGALGGCAGIIGLGAFYRALALGPMAVVPPIAASGVALPVIVGLASGAAPSERTVGALAVAVLGVVVSSIGSGAETASGERPARISPAALALCAVAACGFALIFVALDAAAGSSPGQALVATAGARIGSAALIGSALLVRRIDPREGVPPRRALAFGGIGLLDTSANLAFALACTSGSLEVVAVLGSLYPAVTSALAHLVLGERLGRVQLVGVVLALVGFGLLAGS